VRGIGDRQAEISDTRAEIRALVSYITPPVARLVQAAQDPAQEPALAGLLGVKAYRVTPFDPDAAAHPGVYNALWIALSRLDAAAARELIAPVAKPAGKLGTTRSAVLVGKICGIVTRGLTREEWTRFLPAGAPYTAKAANPCR
jgi:hypothetical protein